MLRSALWKVMWLGRAMVFLVGLAVILALVFGAASTALGANGKPFILGKRNVAKAVSTLVKRGGGPALKLHVGSGPPLTVNSGARVANLNADKVDGHDAPLWAVINANGSTARGAGVVSSTNNVSQGSSAGSYTVSFDRNVSGCAYLASIGGTQTGFKGEITAFGNGGNPNAVNVVTSDSAGNAEPARPFHLAVLC